MVLDLIVIVLNYRTADLTIDCLSSLAAEIDAGTRVLVVDNASGDGSAERLERTVTERVWSNWAQVVRSPVNGGFAAGNNLGIRSADAAAYVLLNSDTVVRRGALRSLREALRLHPAAGIVGAGLFTAQGDRDPSFFRVPKPLSGMIRAVSVGPIGRLLQSVHPDRAPKDPPAEPGWVGFACVLVRREVFEAVGMLDEGYFMYFEDVDFCRRASQAGWEILYWPKAEVVHLHGGSSGVTSDSGRLQRAPRYYYEARSRYYAKFYGRRGLWLANFGWYVGRAVSVLRALGGSPGSYREREALDIWTNAAHPLRSRGGSRS